MKANGMNHRYTYISEGSDKFVSWLQASDGEKSDQDLVVDDASEVTIEEHMEFL